MITIYKYQFELATDIEIEMPANSKVLDVQIQQINTDVLKPVMWAIIDTDQPIVKRKFKAYWTGDQLNGLDLFRTHIATIQDIYIWHIFE